VFRRAIETAAHLGVRTIAGFAGAVIETEVDKRGGQVVYKPLENYLPRLLEFWEPLARMAADHGVRIAFENCPQGVWHLPVMHYNILGQPAMWERFFNATRCENFGIEWDPSHLICQFIDPVANIRMFGPRIFHVHAKDVRVDRDRLNEVGILATPLEYHTPKLPGLGEVDWPAFFAALTDAGYTGPVCIEVEDRAYEATLEGRQRALRQSKRFLEQFIA
jgi:sugar phosphate isomerase/epimerase